jgi:DNA helicase-2/ATP-dependent DNA helicase PcrA
MMSGFAGTLNLQQREAASHIEGPLLILAGAGTGKTRVITARAEYMVKEGIDPRLILCITFTNKAATEMKQRLQEMLRDGQGELIVAGTFHSFCLAILREFCEKIGYKRNFVIYGTGDQKSLIRRILKDMLVKEETMKVDQALNQISHARNVGYDLGNPEESLIAAVGLEYTKQLKAKNVMDFDDLLIQTVRLLEQCPEVVRQLHERHQFLMVDEFQDTNALQMRFLRLLCPAPHHICVVGDDDQSIYAWRGAELSNILQFEDFFPNPHVVKLEENYRSTNAILSTANSLIVKNLGRREKRLWSRVEKNDPIQVIAMRDDVAEAKMIVDTIINEHTRNKKEWESFAVLFRTNEQSRVLEKKFREDKVPYRIVGARSFFDRAEIKDLLAYLSVFINEHDDQSLLRIINTPPRGISEGVAEAAYEHSMRGGFSTWVALCDERFLQKQRPAVQLAIRSFTGLLARYMEAGKQKEVSVEKLTEQMLNEIQYFNYLRKGKVKAEEVNRQEEGIRELLDQMKEYDLGKKKKGVMGFVDSVTLDEDRNDKDDLEKKKGVCLITMHASKGLEFDWVFLPGLEQGILPHKRSMDEGMLDEERRLFYVGITRAKRRLCLSYAQTRVKYGESVSKTPSLFLKELDPSYLEMIDYEKMMNKPVTAQEGEDFFSSMRSMLMGSEEGQ